MLGQQVAEEANLGPATLGSRPGPAQFTGTWYVKAMVTNKPIPMEKRPDKVSPVTMTALDGGDLEVSFTFM